MDKQYTVSDGKLMLILTEAAEGGFVVTCPLDPQLITQGETLQEAFLMAYDALDCLRESRKQVFVGPPAGSGPSAPRANESSTRATGDRIDSPARRPGRPTSRRGSRRGLKVSGGSPPGTDEPEGDRE